MIATGARYRRLEVPDLERFEGACVHYWASPLEGKLCTGQEVALVGGGNSAGQAVVYLAGRVAKVWLLVRGRDLGSSMSRYLVDRIEGLPNVEIITQAQITGLEGQPGRLEAVRWRLRTGEEIRRPMRHLFLFIGASPNTQWLDPSHVALDPKGFVLTGADVAPGRRLVGDEPQRRLRRRGRPFRFGEAGGCGGGRGGAGGGRPSRLSGEGLRSDRGPRRDSYSRHRQFPQHPTSLRNSKTISIWASSRHRAHDDALGGPP